MKKLSILLFCFSTQLLLAQTNPTEKNKTATDVSKIVKTTDQSIHLIDQNKSSVDKGTDAVKNFFHKKDKSEDKKTKDSTYTNADPIHDLTGRWKSNYYMNTRFDGYEREFYIARVNDVLYNGIMRVGNKKFYEDIPITLTRNGNECTVDRIYRKLRGPDGKEYEWYPERLNVKLDDKSEEMKGGCEGAGCTLPHVIAKRKSEVLTAEEKKSLDDYYKPNIEITDVTFQSASGSDHLGYMETGSVYFKVTNKSLTTSQPLGCTFSPSDANIEIKNYYGLGDQALQGGQTLPCRLEFKANDRLLNDVSIGISVHVKGSNDQLIFKLASIPVKNE